MTDAPNPTSANASPYDDRVTQALRVADFLEHHPGSTNKEINVACDAGSVTKLLSLMAKPVEAGGMSYTMHKTRKQVKTINGKLRRVVAYYLISRPV